MIQLGESYTSADPEYFVRFVAQVGNCTREVNSKLETARAGARRHCEGSRKNGARSISYTEQR